MLAYRRFPFSFIRRHQILPQLPRTACQSFQLCFSKRERGCRFRGEVLWPSERGCGRVVVDCEMGRWSGDGQAECGGGDAEVGIGLDAPTPDL